LGTWEIKKDDGSFGATLVLNPDKKTINKSTILGPQDIISSIQETFNKFSIPVIVTDGKLLSRAPFDNKDIIKAIADVVKTEEF
jgi:predicted thioredoxin/glutaredoxin